ncbi:hypothetical protein AWC17_00065 [Mycobacterium nebraskense]|uniref:Uncharacterized protein n=2 Tax=Mycobacterium TaxID=1763 RepID=A0A1X0JU76_MYCSC|nr:hypothetical protein ABW17_29275 [Mycobacterium nebraskense]ORB66489.1 hypothetical protein BST44_27960 [Mycobacterium scrofulaceum]ORV19726.1 hypothetical protein AWB97_25365 [Mycobacterium intracellulare subsp. chimaera]ORW25733.1 hypothetical protein AWC17_00065 [Mycobacterium nebraskense]
MELGLGAVDVALERGAILTSAGPSEPLAKLITSPTHRAVATTADPAVIHANGSRRRFGAGRDGDGE